MSSVWETLSKVDVSDHTEEKNGLTYLSWAWAWGEVKNNFPQAKYIKHIWNTETYLDNPDRPDRGLPYTKDEHGYSYVAVTVRIGEDEQTEIMPVLDYKNKAVQNQIAIKLILPCKDAWQSAVQCMVWVTTSTLERTYQKVQSRRLL